ncbi:MAG: hypothetical protein DMG61_13555 [Acidobacteria bacterium]|nr:MAG: hypothetical protein DMG61_13555 [Acidobacteriota bacterium]
MKRYVALALCTCLVPSISLAQVGRHGGGQRVNVQNRSSNVNRNYNNNTNINRNVNVNQDNNWNWGSFAAGAAVGVATTAVVASAAHSSSNTTVVVQAPAVGGVVPTLPGGCATIASGGAMIYQCSNVYYRPYYQGTQVVYQVVTYP